MENIAEIAWYEQAVVLLFVAGFLALGLYVAKRHQSGISGLWFANRALPLPVLTLTMLATWMGTLMFLTTPSSGYTDGWLWYIPFFVTFAFVAPLMAILTMKKARSLGLVTAVDLFSARFGVAGSVVGMLIVTAAEIIWAGGVFLCFSYVLSSMMGVSVMTATIICAAVVTIYVSVGGMWSVAWTDTLQGIVLTISFIALVAYAWAFGGGLETLGAEAVKTGVSGQPLGNLYPAGDVPTAVYWWNMFAFVLFGSVMYSSMFSRQISARKDDDFKKASIPFFIVYLIFMTGCIMVGIWGRQLFPELKNPDYIVPLLTVKMVNTPGIWRFLGIATLIGLTGAALSTLDSNVLASTTMITRNIFQKIFPHWGERRIRKSFRWVVVGLVVAIVIIANLGLNLVYILALCMEVALLAFVPFIAGLYWEKLNPAGGLCALGSGFVVYVLVKIFLETPWIFPAASLTGAVCGGIVMIVVTLATQKISPPVPLTKEYILPTFEDEVEGPDSKPGQA